MKFDKNNVVAINVIGFQWIVNIESQFNVLIRKYEMRKERILWQNKVLLKNPEPGQVHALWEEFNKMFTVTHNDHSH